MESPTSDQHWGKSFQRAEGESQPLPGGKPAGEPQQRQEGERGSLIPAGMAPSPSQCGKSLKCQCGLKQHPGLELNPCWSEKYQYGLKWHPGLEFLVGLILLKNKKSGEMRCWRIFSTSHEMFLEASGSCSRGRASNLSLNKFRGGFGLSEVLRSPIPCNEAGSKYATSREAEQITEDLPKSHPAGKCLSAPIPHSALQRVISTPVPQRKEI